MRALDREERLSKFFNASFGVEGRIEEFAEAAKRKTCLDEAGSLSNLFDFSSFATFLSSDSISR